MKNNLAEALRSGKDQALEEIYKKAFPIVRRHIIKNSGSAEEAKDIFQDGLHQLLRKIYNKDIDNNIELIPYLLGICKNLWLKRLNKIRISATSPDDTLDVFPQEQEEEVYSETLISLVHHYLSETGNKCKSILTAYYFRNMTMKEISVQLGYKTEASAKNRKYSCLQVLIKMSKEKLLQYL